MPKPSAAGKIETRLTGLYWPCGVNEIKHPGRPKAIPIYRKRKHFIHCGCKFFAYLPPDWHDGIGLTAAQARAKGLDIDTRIIAPPD